MQLGFWLGPIICLPEPNLGILEGLIEIGCKEIPVVSRLEGFWDLGWKFGFFDRDYVQFIVFVVVIWWNHEELEVLSCYNL